MKKKRIPLWKHEDQQKLFKYLPEEIEEIEENEFILFDRIEKIKGIINQYGEENFYFAYSGGKDSTVLHYLLDMAIPGNKIPRVFCNTGLEFRLIYKFVKSLQEKDERIVMISPRKNIVKTLERVGYPFKSKQHSKQIDQWKRGSRAKSVLYYKNMQGKTKFACPRKLLYQYDDEFKLKISDKCCYEFKKEIFRKWERESKKIINITGMRKSEGGQREYNSGCTIFNKNNLKSFNPLFVVSNSWEDWFIDKYNIRLCDLYYYPYNFERTGCVGCPFDIHIKQDLEILKEKLPNEYRRAWLYFEPVYREYKRIGYRLNER